MSTTRRLSNTSNLVRYSFLVLFLFEVLAGPIRFVFGSYGAYELVYAPKVELALVILVLVGTGQLLAKEFYWFAVVALLSALWGAQQLPSVEQSLFALWTMVPFAFSLIAAKYVFLDLSSYRRIFLCLYVIVLSGIFLNYFIDFPWAGLNFQIAGQEVETARSWGTGGYSRISGLSRTSYDAAAQMLVLLIFVVQQTESKFLSLIFWFLAGIAILLTTAKGVILSFAIITIYFFARQAGSRIGPLAWFGICISLRSIIIFFLLIMIYAPLSTLSSRYHLDSRTYLSSLLFLSFQERLVYTWPQALALLKGNLNFLFGNGIGGIGAGQSYFDPLNYNPADNLFVFLLVQYGLVLSFAILLLFAVNVIRVTISKIELSNNFAFVCLCLFLVIYGCTTNELEDVFLSTSFGFCLAYKKGWTSPASRIGGMET